MRICGIQKLAMVDYPGKLATTIFTGGCNLRCPFCHNALLVTRLDESPQISEDEVFEFLKSRKGLLDGVVLSGGEPLLQKNAPDFLRKVKDMGFAVKLDTNGCYPEMLKHILKNGLADYVAVDIKNSKLKYGQTVGIENFDITPIEDSIKILKDSKTEYEFRTTVVQEFHTEEDICDIGKWLEGSPKYFIQNFVDSGNLIGSGLHSLTDEKIQDFAEKARPFFKEVAIRGI